MSKARKADDEPELGVFRFPAWGCRCRCGHVWVPREWLKVVTETGGEPPEPGERDRPRVCPECKSALWDRPKKFERGKKDE